MGITKDFFSKPVVIPITLIENIINEETGEIEQSKIRLLFTLRRETHAEATEAAVQSVLQPETIGEVRFKQFCNLLQCEPSGFDDFPKDERPLRDRAKEYFTGDQYEPMIRTIMLFYEQATTPLEAYRSV